MLQIKKHSKKWCTFSLDSFSIMHCHYKTLSVIVQLTLSSNPSDISAPGWFGWELFVFLGSTHFFHSDALTRTPLPLPPLLNFGIRKMIQILRRIELVPLLQGVILPFVAPQKVFEARAGGPQGLACGVQGLSGSPSHPPSQSFVFLLMCLKIAGMGWAQTLSPASSLGGQSIISVSISVTAQP